MLSDWEVKDVLGWNADLLTREANWRQTYEPVFVLAPKAPADSDETENASAHRDRSKNKDEV